MILAIEKASLEDKHTLDSGPVYLSGVQALVCQRRHDLAAGLRAVGFISGY